MKIPWLKAFVRLPLFGAVVLSFAACSKQVQQPVSDSHPVVPVSSSTVLTPLTNMVSIKAGTFVRLRHLVTLTQDFWLGKYEVTQAEFSELISRNPSFFANRPTCPVEKVTHQDAISYCTALTTRERNAGRLPPDFEYRLPTEAEWEYACRAGTTNHFSFGKSEENAHDYGWTAENAEGTSHPVGMKRPNPWGLHDMHGNVWEWCQDWFGEYPQSALVNPSGPTASKYKVFRGGGWNQDVKYARSSNRFMMAPDNGINFVGFRVALSKRVVAQ